MKNNNRFLLFLKKIWRWISKYPALVAISFIVPITISTLNYFFSGDYFFENLYFEGNVLKLMLKLSNSSQSSV